MESNERQGFDEDMEVTKSPIEQTIDLLNAIKGNTNNCIEMASNLLSRLKDNQLPTKDGNSLIELKNKLFITYLMDLIFLMWNKVDGQQIEGSDAIRRLVENRTVLERIKPIEHKLKYTFDKLIKTSTEGTVDPNDPLNFKPKLNSIIGGKDDNMNVEEDNRPENSDIDDEEQQIEDMTPKAKSNVYVPPKVAQMRFEEEEDRKTKALERAKKRAINSSIIAELRHEFDTGPEEVSHSSHSSQTRIHRFLKDKTAYEEEYMTRMSLTKKQRNEAKRVQTMTSLSDGLTRFEDISALDVDNTDDFQLPNKKKRSSKPKNSSKRKKFSKLRK